MKRLCSSQRLGLALTLGCVIGCDRPADPPLMQQSEAVASESGPPPVVPAGPPRVELDGTSHAGSVTLLAPGMKRVYSIAPKTWIHEGPKRSSARLGYLRAGGSAPTTGELAGNDQCKGGWYPILPRGYICLGAQATFDANDPIVRASEPFPPRTDRKLPYIYGTVRRKGPIYARLPNEAELREEEPKIEKRMAKWLDTDDEAGASYAQHVWLGGNGATPPDPRVAWETKQTEALPGYLSNGGQAPNLLGKPREDGQLVIDRSELKVGYSFLETFLWQGRRYGVSTELKILATDQLRPIQGSEFHGYEIGKDVDFPFAIVRHGGAKFRDGSPAEYHAALGLTGKQQFFERVLHYETKDGKWISDRFASRLDAAKKLPAWGKRGEKWIDVNLSKQVLVLYEGEKPVYATLISSGEAGLEDPEHTTATKRGVFRIHTKHISTTMASSELGEEFELQDVPYVQYFDKGGYALHGAYWHDRFGTPKSHGCINLAPEDARRIFFWTEPQVPIGWHGVLLPLRGTTIFIHP